MTKMAAWLKTSTRIIAFGQRRVDLTIISAVE